MASFKVWAGSLQHLDAKLDLLLRVYQAYRDEWSKFL
jgi:hypothetical protein